MCNAVSTSMNITRAYDEGLGEMAKEPPILRMYPLNMNDEGPISQNVDKPAKSISLPPHQDLAKIHMATVGAVLQSIE